MIPTNGPRDARPTLLAGLALLLGGCGEDAPSPSPAPPRPSTEAAARDDRAVTHLVDHWDRVSSLDSVLTRLDPDRRLELDLASSRPLGPHRLLPLAWPARTGSIQIHRGETSIPIRSSLAELEGEGGACLLKRRVRVEAENVIQFEDLQRARLREHAILKADEEWILAVDLADRPVELRVHLRGWPSHTAAVDLFLDGEALACFDDLNEEWETRRLTLSGEVGTHRLALRPRLVSGESRRGHLVMFDWAELENGTGDALVLDPEIVDEDLSVSMVPAPPAVFQALPRDPAAPERHVLPLLGGAASLLDGSDAARPLPPGRAPGLHSMELPDTPPGDEALVLHQPDAALIPFLDAKRMRLRDDSAWDTRHDGVVAAEVADRVLSRLECDHDRRVAFLLPAPSRLAVEVELRAGDRLRFAVGVGELQDVVSANREADTQFALRLERDGVDGTKAPPLWSGIRRSGQGWLDVELEIDEALAGAGRLILETSGGHPDETPASAFADPRLVPSEPRRERPNLLLYLIDTLRADRLSCYGAQHATSPTIDRLAREGYRFTRFHAVAAHTRPSTASALTGLHPRYHAASGLDRSLPLRTLTLAEMLRDAGLSNHAFVANNQVAGRGIHFEQGFHRFVAPLHFLPEGSARASSEAMHEKVVPWLRQQGDEPFFLYLHTIDPHTPYAPPPEQRDRFDPDYQGPFKELELSNAKINQLLKSRGIDGRDREYLLAVYDAQIRHQDDQIGKLLAVMEEEGVLEDTVVAIFSDHGEEFGEHNQYYHGGRMWKQLIDVPLVLWVPEKWRGRLGDRLAPPGQVLDVRSSHLDLVPTLVDLLGADAEPTWQGESLLPYLGGEPARPRVYLGQDRDGIGALVTGDEKLIWFDRRGRMEMTFGLYDLETDPDERHNLAPQQPDRVAELRQLLDDIHAAYEARGFAPITDPERVELDAEAARQLAALGYIDDPPDEAEEDDR